MTIHTLTVIDIETGEVLRDETYEYTGALALCDRAAQSAATAATNQATANQKAYGADVQAIQPGLVSQLQGMATNPQGFGAAGVNDMQNEAQAAAGATADKTAEGLKLGAMRTGNYAGLGAGQIASTEAASQGQTGAIQKILAQNALLKAQQQQGALTGLSDVMGRDIAAQQGSVGQQISGANAITNAGKSGWFQNLLGAATGGAVAANQGASALSKL